MNRYLRIFAVLILGAVVTSATLAGISSKAKIKVDNPYIDFGYIPFDFNIIHYYKINNIGKDILRFNKIIPNCDCTYAIPSDTIVRPGDSAEIKIVFGTEQYYGPNTRKIELWTNDPIDSIVYLEYASNIGTYPKYFRISPISLFFLPGHEKKKISLANFSKKDVDFQIIIPKDSLISVEQAESTIDASVPFELYVHTKKDLPKGSYETNLTIQYESKPIERITVPIKIVR